MAKIKRIVVDFIVYLFFLLFFLAVLELFLGLIGKFIIWYRQPEVKIANQENLTIACFGDSYTYGGLGLRSTSYPAYLNNLCNSANVENEGVCESNSTQVLNDIEKYIKTRKKPDIAVVLVGASNKYNNYGMNKYNFYQKLKVYKMFEIIKLAIKNKILKKDIDKDFIDECTSGYYLFSDMNTVCDDLKKVDYTYGTMEEVEELIAKSYSRSDSASESVIKNKIKELLDTLNDEQKKLNVFNLYGIYNFLEDEQQKEYLYDLMYKKNPNKAKEFKSLSLLNSYFAEPNEDEKLKILNEIIKVNPGLGYEKKADFYIRKIPYTKEDEKKENIKKMAQKAMSDYFNYEPSNVRKSQLQIMYYINNFEFDKALSLYEKELKDENREFNIYFYSKMAYCSIYSNNFSDGVYYFLQAFKSVEYAIDKNVGYYFLKAFDLQNKYSADFVLENLDEILKDNDNLRETSYIKYLYKVLNERKKTENDILKWLEKDLNKIVSLCEKNNIKIILQTYPFPYNSVNDIVRNICSINKDVVLVDQNDIFQRLVEKDGVYPYFLDFDHCTEKGHYIMAENIYSVLLEKNLIKE